MRMCPDCMKGRMTALTTPPSDTVYENLGPMEHLATDDKGPFSTKTVHGYVRFDLFSFRSSKYLMVRFKRHKNDFLANLQDVVNFAEMAGQTVRLLQTDDDSKMYASTDVQKYCAKKHILLRRASAYKHEQNGWIERDMRSVLEKARTLMMVYSCPLRFWDYAVEMAVYLINRSPNNYNARKTPYEMVTGKKPDISHLVPFFAPGIYHLTNEERKHGWSAKAEECRLLGYEDKNLYLIYVPRTQAILRRRDCRFDESSEFTQSPSMHQEDLLRHYPLLRQADKEDTIINDHADFFDDLPYFDPDDDDPTDDLLPDENEKDDDDSTTYPRLDDELANSVSASVLLPRVPNSVDEALNGSDREKWIEAIDAELKQLTARGTFEYAGTTGTGAKSKLILSVKFDNNMQVKYKARLVLCGYSQVKGVDYNRTFAPTISKAPIFIILHMAAIKAWCIKLIDVGNAFLEGKNDFDIYMYLPRYVLPRDHPAIRLKVINSLYGEKQAAYIWNERLNHILTRHAKLTRSIADPCVYTLKDELIEQPIAAVIVHVDDILVTGRDEMLVTTIISIIRHNVTKLTHYDDFKRYLNIDLKYDKDNHAVYLNQTQYAEEIMQEFSDMLESRASMPSSSRKQYNVPIDPLTRSTYETDSDDDTTTFFAPGSCSQQHTISMLPFVGKVRYLVDNSRPDLLAAIGIMSEGATHGSQSLLITCRDFLRYLAQDHAKGLKLGGCDHTVELFGYSDASYTNTGTCKSRLGGCFFVSRDSGAIHCFSKKDTTVSHSSTEAEVKAIDLAIRSIVHIRELLKELGYEQTRPTRLYVDNRSAIEICETLKIGHKTRHINVRLHYIREKVNDRTIELLPIQSELNIADLLTKPLHVTAFRRFQRRLLQGCSEEETG